MWVFASVGMSLISLAVHQSPSEEEGCTLALIMVDQILDVFASFHFEAEPETSSNSNHKTNTDHQTLNLNTDTITAANIHTIDIAKIPHFSSKTLEIMHDLQHCEFTSWRFQTVPDNFYSLDLDVRARDVLGAPSTSHLWKSLLMRNTKCSNDDCADRSNSKYYLVLFQYDTKLRQQKLQKFVKKMSGKSNKFIKFSLATAEETRALTGFEYNCVSPFGVGNIPVIISHHIVESKLDYVWIGSGSLNVKLRVDTQELCRKLPHFVADITV